jgi:hypothetical protein
MIAGVDPDVDLADQETAVVTSASSPRRETGPPDRGRRDRKAAQGLEAELRPQRESGLAGVPGSYPIARYALSRFSSIRFRTGTLASR